jgi:hypothetical protein
MGQKTGTSNIEKKVIRKATQKALVIAYLKAEPKKQVIFGVWNS